MVKTGPDTVKYFRFARLLRNAGWISPAYVGVDRQGVIQYLSVNPPDTSAAVEAVNGYALPGFFNSHSHAFQYAMAGLAESHQAGIHDDFWSWREAMYHCALSVDPDQAEAIAAMLYAEMLRHGYSHVTEFHYLHHDKAGKPYGNLAEMGERMVAAAATAGIHITLVPVFYQTGNFGVQAQPRQRRFLSKNTVEYFHLLEASKRVVQNKRHALLGFSVHSLRAVQFEDVKLTFKEGPSDIPFHLHAAEQLKEVEDCVKFSGRRPVQWLLENMPVNERFHIVHATHLNDAEMSALARSGANVVLCPSTEGNLGDGIFRMKEFVLAGGHWSIGTDSHIGLSPFEEFRMMDYRQRLITNLRNTFDGDAASYLINEANATGMRAAGLEGQDLFEVGQPLNAVVFDAWSPLLANASEKHLLPSIVYASDSAMIKGTMVDGEWKVKDQQHLNGAHIQKQFLSAMKRLANR